MYAANDCFNGKLFGYCNKNLACTTCKVYIPKKYENLLPEPSDLELDVIGTTELLGRTP